MHNLARPVRTKKTGSIPPEGGKRWDPPYRKESRVKPPNNLTVLSGQVVMHRMREHKREILEILFPGVRAGLLRVLFSKPAKPRFVRELRNLTGFRLATVQDELGKLSAIGVLGSWTDGYRRFYSPNPQNPISATLQQLVEASARVPGISRRLLPRPRKSRRHPKAARLRPDPGPTWGLFEGSRRPRR
jgi:hypothetical protein